MDPIDLLLFACGVVIGWQTWPLLLRAIRRGR